MKLIVFKNKKNQVFLNVEDIRSIYNHDFSYYTETTIILKDGFAITMIDHNHSDFHVSYLHEFIINPERTFEVVRVADIKINNDYCNFVLLDWISAIMKG